METSDDESSILTDPCKRISAFLLQPVAKIYISVYHIIFHLCFTFRKILIHRIDFPIFSIGSHLFATANVGCRLLYNTGESPPEPETVPDLSGSSS
jgi:hypothetical protein